MLNLKIVAFLRTSEFPLEIPRTQKHNFPYTKTLATIKNHEKLTELGTFYYICIIK